MTAQLKEAGGASLRLRILRVCASGLVALALSGTALIVFSVVFEALEIRQKTGLDDDLCFFALGLGPLGMAYFHRTLHSTRWAPRACLALGVLILLASALVFTSASAALARHVSGGPFSGIGYAMGQILAVFFTIVGLCAGIGGVLAMRGRRAGRG
jgi:hypothetical protein